MEYLEIHILKFDPCYLFVFAFEAKIRVQKAKLTLQKIKP